MHMFYCRCLAMNEGVRCGLTRMIHRRPRFQMGTTSLDSFRKLLLKVILVLCSFFFFNSLLSRRGLPHDGG